MNEDLRQFALRAKDFLGSLAWSVQGVSILLLTAIVMLPLVLFLTSTKEASYQPLFPDRALNQSELQKIRAALGTAKLDVYEVRDGQLHVPEDQRAQYFSAINQAGCLPESFHDAVNQSMENRSFIELGPQQEERRQHARERELQLALRRIPGVDDASVLFDKTPPRGLLAETEITAVVNVQTLADYPLDPNVLRTIRDMVLYFKAGLQSENILIIDLRAGVSYPGSMLPEAGSAIARTMLQSSLERQWREKLSSVLSFVPDARVTVRVRLGDESTAVDQPHDVRVSVGVPTSYLNRLQDARQRRHARGSRESPPSWEEIEQQTREKIQAAVGLLLPGALTAAEAKNMVIVTSFDDLSSLAAAAPTRWSQTLHSSSVWIFAVVITVAAGWTTYLVRSQRINSASDEPRLNVVTELADVTPHPSKSDVEAMDDDALRERLQTFVADDPEAAARSLAKWIDKAG